jgi:hypothetical protein
VPNCSASSAPCRIQAALLPGDVEFDHLALHCHGRQPLVPERDRQVAQPQQVLGEGSHRLAARPFAAIHVDRQADHQPGDDAVVHDPQQFLRIGGELGAADGADRRGQRQARIRHRHADRLLAQVEPDQPPVGGQQGLEVAKIADRHIG